MVQRLKYWIRKPFDEKKCLVRMSWSPLNLKNLLRAEKPRLDNLTVYQQRFKAKKYLRGYHNPIISEKQFLNRHFTTELPTKVFSKEEREKLLPIQTITMGELERRLDMVVFRSLFAYSIWWARRAVVHGHVKVNGEVCKHPAWRINDGDIVTVNPKYVPTLMKKKQDPAAPREFKQVPFMAPWMFIPTFLEVCFGTCSSIFLRSPLAQPGIMEIPSPYPPQFHQLAHEWYSTKKRAQKRSPPKPQLIISGETVKLKPKFDRILRKDRAELLKNIQNERKEKREIELQIEEFKFKSQGNAA